MRHANLITLHNVFETPDSVNLVFEYFRGGDLRRRLSKKGALSEQTALKLFAQIMQGVSFLHSQGIVHRDLKPDNIYLLYNIYWYNYRKKARKIRVVTGDFGLAIRLGSISNFIKCGSPGYMAPEVFLGKTYNEKIDIYSCGVILYYM